MTDLYKKFGTQCFPMIGNKLNQLEWCTRYAPHELTLTDHIQVASVISAYRALIAMPAKRRDAIMNALRNDVEEES